MKQIRFLLAFLLLAVLAGIPGRGAFPDVPGDAYYKNPVDWAVSNGVTDGVSETEFAPDEPCTRAQIVGFLWKLAGRPQAADVTRFADVDQDSWYYAPVCWAVEAGVTDGVSETEFQPDRTCTRAEGAAFLYKYYGRAAVNGAVPFTDVSRADWFHSAVLWCVQQGIVSGVTRTEFAPYEVFTRAHIVTMLCRAETSDPPQPVTGVYLGVQNYGSVSDKDAMAHRFWYQNAEHTAAIPSEGGAYTIQNQLQEGAVYDLLFRDGVLLNAEPIEAKTLTELPTVPVYQVQKRAGGAVVSPAQARIGTYAVEAADAVYLTEAPVTYSPPIHGTPGSKTVRNFLLTALEPVGTTLYVYGGGWNWQDNAADSAASSIGVSDSWVRFFRSQDPGYDYKNSDAAFSWYPFGGWNQYHYHGLDCSGYVGWAVYNTVESESGHSGCVTFADRQAKLLEEKGLGSLSSSVGRLLPGDVFSMQGHVWISLGTCSDGSILILHSTPSTSRTGSKGGGVQISAIGSAGSEAAQLAEKYMSACWPEWYARYPIRICEPGSYLSCVGHFTWSDSLDPDGCRQMAPAELLRNLFGF